MSPDVEKRVDDRFQVNQRHFRRFLGRWMIMIAFVVLIPMIVGVALLDHNGRRDSDRALAAAVAAQLSAEQAADRAASQLRLSQARDAWARYDDGLEACHRGRLLREQLNTNNAAVLSITFLVASTFNDGALDQLREGDPARAEELREARDRLAALALKLEPLDQPNCRQVIARPNVDRPPPPTTKEKP